MASSTSEEEAVDVDDRYPGRRLLREELRFLMQMLLSEDERQRCVCEDGRATVSCASFLEALSDAEVLSSYSLCESSDADLRDAGLARAHVQWAARLRKERAKLLAAWQRTKSADAIRERLTWWQQHEGLLAIEVRPRPASPALLRLPAAAPLTHR